MLCLSPTPSWPEDICSLVICACYECLVFTLQLKPRIGVELNKITQHLSVLGSPSGPISEMVGSTVWWVIPSKSPNFSEMGFPATRPVWSQTSWRLTRSSTFGILQIWILLKTCGSMYVGQAPPQLASSNSEMSSPSSGPLSWSSPAARS